MHEFQGHIQESKLGGGALIEAGDLGSSWISEILLTLKHVLIAENLQIFYIYI